MTQNIYLNIHFFFKLKKSNKFKTVKKIFLNNIEIDIFGIF